MNPTGSQAILKNRVALITGGGTGIGRGIAEAFAAAGAAVAVTGRRKERIEEVAVWLRKNGATALSIAGDVAKREDAKRMVEETVQQLGGLNILVNNAGIARFGALVDTSDEDIDASIDINVKGPLYVTKAAIPYLQKRGDWKSVILNVSTSATSVAVGNFSVYCASKAAINQLTRCWAMDLGPDGIRVNAILPGVVETPIFETMMPKEGIARALRDFASKHPLRRVGTPDDIARAALFLCGPDADWITGALLNVDGGLGLG